MKKTNLATIIMIFLMGMFLTSCERNPLERLSDPFPGGALNAWSGVFIVYNDDLRTGGNVAFIPSDVAPPANNQSIDFLNTEENPPEGLNCIKYSWNGKDLYWDDATVPFKGYEHEWAGVTLLVATHWSFYNSTPAKDLSPGGYTKITFKAKAFIANDTYVKFEGPVSTNVAVPSRGGTDYLRLNNTELADWNSYTLNLSSNSLKKVKDYFKIVIEYPAGKNNGSVGYGGTVFVDDIRYTK
jgi:hypothetical protein